MKNFFRKLKEGIERFLPMTLGSLLLFSITIYVFYIVGRSVWNNYNSNKSIEVEEMKLVDLEQETNDLRNEINYYQTFSFKEKEARSKLGYKAPGENVIPLPLDGKDEIAEQQKEDIRIKTPNYRYWFEYYFGS